MTATVVGIDTLRLGGLSRRNSSRMAGWSSGSCKTDEFGGLVATSLRRKLDCGAVLDLQLAGDVERSYVEFSASRLAGHRDFVPLSQVRDMAATVLEEAAEFVELYETNVNRLDAGRHFQMGPGEISCWINAQGSVPVGGVKKQEVFRDSKLGGAQTLWVWNKSGGVRAYDKGEETKLDQYRDVLRVESQDRGRTLRANGIKSFSLLTEHHVETVARARFGWAGMNRPVTQEQVAIDRIWSCPELTDGQKTQATAGYAMAKAGMWALLGDAHRRSRVRKYLLIAGVGVAAAEAAVAATPIIFGIANDPSPNVFQLDFDRGVLRIAA